MKSLKDYKEVHTRNAIFVSMTNLLLFLSMTIVCLTVGCGGQSNKTAPTDPERARQEHMDMMKRESGHGG